MNIPKANSHHALRQATSDAHSRLDAIVGGGLHSHVGYAAYLRGMQQLIAVALRAMPAHRDLQRCRERLASDLRALQVASLPLPPSDTASIAADPVAQLGWEYVISGASVGARYLLRQVHALGYTAEHGAQFLGDHAGGDSWPRFLARLAQADLSEDQREHLCGAALAAFAAAEQAFHSAYRSCPRTETCA